MIRPDPERLLAALESPTRGAVGRAPRDAAVELASRLVAARRGSLKDPPCPERALRRALALFRPRRAPVFATLASLAFDSWTGAAAPARGVDMDRMLRFAHDDAAVDLEVRPQDQGRALRLGVAVEGLPAGGRVAVLDPTGAPLATAALDEHDSAVLDLPAAGDFLVVVEDADGEVLRTPRVERGAA
jgi:hypothetical protein